VTIKAPVSTEPEPRLPAAEAADDTAPIRLAISNVCLCFPTGAPDFENHYDNVDNPDKKPNISTHSRGVVTVDGVRVFPGAPEHCRVAALVRV
jgi:hypothetical protein